MNKTLQKFARDNLVSWLDLVEPQQYNLFKRMYSPHNLDLSTEEIVKVIPADKLSHAMDQVQNTLRKMKIYVGE